GWDQTPGDAPIPNIQSNHRLMGFAALNAILGLRNDPYPRLRMSRSAPIGSGSPKLFILFADDSGASPMTLKTASLLALLLASGSAFADTTVTLHAVSAESVGKALGDVTISSTEYGLVFTPDLKGLPPGLHGFHLHQNPSCDPAENDGKMTAAQAAGGHYDPHSTGKHGTPWGDGHLGDLPGLYVEEKGTA